MKNIHARESDLNQISRFLSSAQRLSSFQPRDELTSLARDERTNKANGVFTALVINATTRKRVGRSVGRSLARSLARRSFVFFSLSLLLDPPNMERDRYKSFVTLSGCGVAKKKGKKRKNCAVNGAPSVEERA